MYLAVYSTSVVLIEFYKTFYFQSLASDGAQYYSGIDYK